MEFDSLCEAIRSPSLRAVADHWHAARGAGLMPSWTQLRPAAMARQLPIIWAYTYDPQDKVFTGRLAGERIAQVFGKRFRGIRLEEIHPPQTLPAVLEVMNRVVQTPAIYHSSGLLFRKGGRTGLGERIILPLKGGDGVIGASDYIYAPGQDDGAQIELMRDQEHWLDLAA